MLPDVPYIWAHIPGHHNVKHYYQRYTSFVYPGNSTKGNWSATAQIWTNCIILVDHASPNSIYSTVCH